VQEICELVEDESSSDSTGELSDILESNFKPFISSINTSSNEDNVKLEKVEPVEEVEVEEVEEVEEVKEVTKFEKLEKHEIYELNDNELDKYTMSDIFIEKSYLYITYSLKFTYGIIKFIIRVSGIYLLWIFLHYIASHLYIHLCVPNSWYGLLLSPFLVETPHCKGLRWIVYNGANIVSNMWIVLGSWLCTILITKTDNIGNA
jgi:hypothetical protein